MKAAFHIQFILLLALTPIYGQDDYVDTAYGIDGVATIDLPAGSLGVIEYISMDSFDNAYVLAGQNYPVLIKLLPEGIIDTSFGDQGYYYKPNYSTYQKDNYLISMRDIGQSTAVDIYDLDLNFIQGYRLPTTAEINEISFQGSYFIGSTTTGDFFKYTLEGKLDTTFANNGLLEFNSEQFSRVSYLGSYGDSLHLISGIAHHWNDRVTELLIINQEGGIKKEILVDTFTVDSGLSLSFPVIEIVKSHDDKLIVNYHPFDTNSTGIPSRSLKITADGKLDSLFGHNGRLIPDDHDATITGELSSRNFPFINLMTSTPKIHMITQSGALNMEFGSNGYHRLNDVIGDRVDLIVQSPNSDFVFVASNYSFSPSLLFITKLDFSSVPTIEDFASSNKAINSPYENNLYISPNPVVNHFDLTYNGPAVSDITMRITNAKGQTLRRTELNQLESGQTIHVTIDEFNTGQYYISLWDKGKVITGSTFQKLR